MLRLLQWIVMGHVHRWKVRSEGNLNHTRKGQIVETGSRFILQCERCGDVVKRDLI